MPAAPTLRGTLRGALGLSLCAVLSACSSKPSEVAATAAATVSVAPPPSSTTTTQVPTTTSAAPSPTTPALASLPGGTVLAVKIDNTAGSRPRVGVTPAAVVYVEPVEGGLTRLMAVFSTGAGGMPGQVGPIRSARESDVTLLANWGHVTLAYSGGSGYTRSLVDAADLASIPNDAGPQGYRRASDRKAPYNVIGDPQQLLARAGTGPTSGDPGFRFGPPGPAGAPGTSVSTAWAASSIRLTWDAPTGRYLVDVDGRPDVDADGGQHAAATVVVQQVPTHLSENRDVNGVQTPVVDLVGEGAATVLRDGFSWAGEWSRPAANAPTSFTAGGQAVAMATGPVWVLLVPAGQPVSVG